MIEMSFLGQLPQNVKETIIRIALALLALALIWVLRRALTWLIASPINRLLGNRAATRQGQLVFNILQAPARLLVIALGLLVAAQILTPDSASLAFVNRLARSFVILAIALALFKAVDFIGVSSSYIFRVTGIRIEDQLVPFVNAALKAVVVALAVVVVLQEWDYDVSGLIAGLGLAGLAFSLAAQETVANLFAFGTIVSDRPFEVGEYVVTPDVEGIVQSIGPRSTRIRRLDQALVTIPNAKIADSAVINWSRLHKRWMNFIVGVTYSTSAQNMRQLVDRLRQTLQADERVDPDSVLVQFIEFGDSSLNILIRLYIAEPDWSAFQAERERVNLQIMEVIDEAGLSIAFPSRSIYFENFDSRVSAAEAAQFNPATEFGSPQKPLEIKPANARETSDQEHTSKE